MLDDSRWLIELGIVGCVDHLPLGLQENLNPLKRPSRFGISSTLVMFIIMLRSSKTHYCEYKGL